MAFYLLLDETSQKGQEGWTETSNEIMNSLPQCHHQQHFFVMLLHGDGCSSKISIEEFGDLEGVTSENSYQSYAFL